MESGQFNTEVEVLVGLNKDEGLINFLEQLADPGAWDQLTRESLTQAFAQVLLII